MQWSLSVTLTSIIMLAAAGTAIAGASTWYLDEEHVDADPSLPLVMHRDAPDETVGTATIPPHECLIWLSDEPAETEVTFPKDGWAGNIDANEDTIAFFKPFEYPTFLGHGPTIGPLTFVATGRTMFIDDGSLEEIGVVDLAHPPVGGTFTVATGDRLAFKLCNPTDTPVVVQTDGSSWVSSPDDAPPFPVPEWPVLGITLAGLAGIALIAGRRFMNN